MNLKPFVGKKVLVQFRGPFWIVINDKGLPSLGMQPNQKGEVDAAGQPKLEPALMQVHQGTFVEIEGAILFQYMDSASQRKIQVEFHADAIFSVAMVAEADRIVVPG